ncbi:MAG: cyclic nucleotide-binding domain-containing protein [Chloroflexi bacterium]|nr:cyclic nucleotide-binding domain-containing protein [Chloroflexota bacterium]
MEKIEVLKRCPMFHELDEEQLKIIADMATSEVYEVGESLGKQGRSQEKVFIIEDGLVGIYLELGPMMHRQIQAASNFELVCWSAILPPHRMYTTVRAIETTKVLAFKGKELAQLCQTHPQIGCKINRGVAQTIATRLNSAYTQLMGVTAQD